ncbi:MAG: hypothetical protein ACREBH_00945 [Candidatus Micrarchaeaceae archaeon]
MDNPKEKRNGALSSQTFATAKRALSLGKIYIAIAIVIALIGIGINYSISNAAIAGNANVTANSINASSAINAAGKLSKTGSGAVLIQVPLGVIPALMLATPMVILFVYDKNNGVLEYLLSLGMTQRDIYKRYLNATLLITLVYLVVFTIVNLAYSYIAFGTMTITTMYIILFLVAAISLAVVAFMITMMMIFSSLQKSRAGGNQPLAVAMGSLVGALPGYAIPFIFTFNTAVIVEIVQVVVIAVSALTMFMLSGKMIKREKFLP